MRKFFRFRDIVWYILVDLDCVIVGLFVVKRKYLIFVKDNDFLVFIRFFFCVYCLFLVNEFILV